MVNNTPNTSTSPNLVAQPLQVISPTATKTSTIDITKATTGGKKRSNKRSKKVAKKRNQHGGITLTASPNPSIIKSNLAGQSTTVSSQQTYSQGVENAKNDPGANDPTWSNAPSVSTAPTTGGGRRRKSRKCKSNTF